jgi:EAL domain-containing protein (putative c-di-GMP-specific phosphodiesterase class I)
LRPTRQSTIELGHSLGLSVVAEGVETPAALEFLRDAACDEGQGHLFSRPLPWPALPREVPAVDARALVAVPSREVQT